MRRALFTFAALLGLAAPAQAATSSGSGLYDARYCEVLAIDTGQAIATVWNTVGLSDCPAARWAALDASTVASQLGADLVVLNGPRHFLMDSATATTGAVRTIGTLRMRRVATVRLGAAGLTRTPYSDRVISRVNTWRWRAGRTVRELVAPGGDVYVMQSYAQITDPKLSAAGLSGLGSRLALPAGWRFRSRRLRHAMTLAAHGSATVLQDELQDTYQLEKATRPRGARRRHAVHVAGATRIVASRRQGAIEDRGVLSGTPFGAGTSGVLGTIKDGALSGTFWLLYPSGSITGTFSAPFTLAAGVADLVGTATITAGTGAYRGITAAPAALHDSFDIAAGKGHVTIDGAATY